MYDRLLTFGMAINFATLSNGSTDLFNVTDSNGVLDLGQHRDFDDNALTPDLGEGGELWFNFAVDNTAWVGAGGTVTIKLTTKANTSSLDSGTVLYSKAVAINSSTVTAGTPLIRVKVPAGVIQRYLYVNLTGSGADITAGTANGYLSLGTQTPQSQNT